MITCLIIFLIPGFLWKQSTRENKTIYQICREKAGLTRSEASEKMTAVSDSKIEKFEYEMQEPTPYDIIQTGNGFQDYIG